MSDIADRVKKIVVEHLGVEEDKVSENASFIDDLGADSLDTVELVMAFEEEFGIEIPDDAAEGIQTFGDVDARNTMVLAIRERTREIAVLKTIGFSSPRIFKLVLMESCLLEFIGGALGLVGRIGSDKFRTAGQKRRCCRNVMPITAGS